MPSNYLKEKRGCNLSNGLRYERRTLCLRSKFTVSFFPGNSVSVLSSEFKLLLGLHWMLLQEDVDGEGDGSDWSRFDDVIMEI